MREKFIVSLMLAFVVAMSYLSENYTINISSSIPRGIYRLTEAKNIKKGDIVVFKATKKDFKFIEGYTNAKIEKFIKKVAGVEGDYIKIENNTLYINNKKITKIRTRDDFGNKLKIEHINRKLEKGEYYLLGDKINSYDSRYRGVVLQEEIWKKAKIIYKIEK